MGVERVVLVAFGHGRDAENWPGVGLLAAEVLSGEESLNDSRMPRFVLAWILEFAITVFQDLADRRTFANSDSYC